MAKQGGGGSGKGRKKGDWIAIANGRAHRDAVLVKGAGLSNVPRIGEVGSAAYRRLLARKTKWGAAT